MVRYGLILTAGLILSGCSSNLLKDSISDAGGAITTIGCSVITGGNVPACATVGLGTAVSINTVTGVEEGVNLAEVTNEHQEEVAKAEVKANLLEGIAREVIYGVVFFFGILPIITGWIGARRARPEEYSAKAERDVYKRMVEDRRNQ